MEWRTEMGTGTRGGSMADGDRNDVPAPAPRRYSEEEVARILERATEIRKESRLPARREEGLSLTELEEIAAEAGIDVDHLRQAALEVDTTAAGDGETWWRGAETRVVVETVVPGVVPEARIQRLVQVIEEVLDERGHASYLARTLTWRTEMVQGKVRSATVSVTPEEGQTRIRVDEDLKMVSSSAHGGFTWGAGFGVGFGAGFPIAMAAGIPLMAVGIVAGSVGLGFLSARAFFRNYVGKRRTAVAELIRRLTEVIRAESTRPLPGEGSGPG